jgi:hypothetical protein
MSGKRLSRADHETIARLVEKTSVDAVMRSAAAHAAPTREPGRPAYWHPGNLANVYGYLCHHSKDKKPGGGHLGIKGAAVRLKKALDKVMPGNELDAERLRKMYYEATTLAKKSPPHFAKLMEQSVAKHTSYQPMACCPVLLHVGPDGLLNSGPLDKSAFGSDHVELSYSRASPAPKRSSRVGRSVRKSRQ